MRIIEGFRVERYYLDKNRESNGKEIGNWV